MEPSETQLPATITQGEIISPDTVHTTLVVPALIADLGDAVGWRYIEFFTANIRNPHTAEPTPGRAVGSLPGANNAVWHSPQSGSSMSRPL